MAVSFDPKNVECVIIPPEEGKDGVFKTLINKGELVISKKYEGEHLKTGSLALLKERLNAYWDYYACLEDVGLARHLMRQVSLDDSGISIESEDVVFEASPTGVKCDISRIDDDIIATTVTVRGDVVEAAVGSRTDFASQSCPRELYAKCLTSVGRSKHTDTQVKLLSWTNSLWFGDGSGQTITVPQKDLYCGLEPVDLFAFAAKAEGVVVANVVVKGNVLGAEVADVFVTSPSLYLFSNCMEQKGLSTLLGQDIVINTFGANHSGVFMGLKDIDYMSQSYHSLEVEPAEMGCSSGTFGILPSPTGTPWFMITVGGNTVYLSDMNKEDADAAKRICDRTKNFAIASGQMVYINLGNSAVHEAVNLMTVGRPDRDYKTIIKTSRR